MAARSSWAMPRPYSSRPSDPIHGRSGDRPHDRTPHPADRPDLGGSNALVLVLRPQAMGQLPSRHGRHGPGHASGAYAVVLPAVTRCIECAAPIEQPRHAGARRLRCTACAAQRQKLKMREWAQRNPTATKYNPHEKRHRASQVGVRSTGACC